MLIHCELGGTGCQTGEGLWWQVTSLNSLLASLEERGLIRPVAGFIGRA